MSFFHQFKPLTDLLATSMDCYNTFYVVTLRQYEVMDIFVSKTAVHV